ncbi:DUF3152 domain-containing protein [Streptomyces sp. NPDC023723]|uniref:DUF3152 domain-containing protein n=1 Tax=Streptomyces sp. NPDC023723 TaxID=3154323 RepID=UPI0033DD803B
MGRHSRRGPAPKGDTADATAARERRSDRPQESGGRPQERGGPAVPPGQGRGPAPEAAPGDGTPAYGTPAYGAPHTADGTPARGVPRLPDGTPAHGVRQVRGGHPEQREAGGGWGAFGGRGGAPGAPPVSGPGPGPGPAPGPGRGPGSGPGDVPLPRQRQGPSVPRASRTPAGGPRQDYLDAFERGGDGGAGDDVFAARMPAHSRADAPTPDSKATVTDWNADTVRAADGLGEDAAPDLADELGERGSPEAAKGAKGRTFTGIAAAAVTTVLAIVVAGQVTGGGDGEDVGSGPATAQARDTSEPAGGADAGANEQKAQSGADASAPLTYAQKMGKIYPLAATLKGSGKFDAVEGVAKAPGKGQKYTYRVDVEQGLGLDADLFAEAVQKTLNDDRSWAHNNARTFERRHSGKVDFVITLASPGTTADWCAKSGLDTTVDNVSCDSAATERVMINAYRWARGAKTYGDDKIYPYRQMLINHEVGHRLGYNHVTCDKDGDLAPVMQQQTKFLEYNGIRCRPNAWAYPSG